MTIYIDRYVSTSVRLLLYRLVKLTFSVSRLYTWAGEITNISSSDLQAPCQTISISLFNAEIGRTACPEHIVVIVNLNYSTIHANHVKYVLLFTPN